MENQNGCFKTIQKRDGEPLKDIVYEKDTKIKIKNISKKMSNYFSIGIDARIGMGISYLLLIS